MKRFKDILCVVEPQTACQCALERTVALAENNQACVTVVTVTERVPESIRIPEGGPTPGDLQARSMDARAQWLESLIEPYRARIEINAKVLVGTSFLEIIREVIRGRHDLVIKIPEQQSWLRLLLGSDDMHVLRKCPCPVWMIRPNEPRNYKHILAAVDVNDGYSPEELELRHALNRQTMEMALSLALSDFAELHVVYVWDAMGQSPLRGPFMRTTDEEVDAYMERKSQHFTDRLDALIREVTGQLGADAVNYLKPHLHLVQGFARQEIPALAKAINAELIVMGTVARTGIPGVFMGNTAETILEQIDCSVLAIKPPGFVTPVALED